MIMNNQEKSKQEPQIFELVNGDVRLWVEQETIHLAAFDRPHCDPVELSTKMARALAAKLKEMADKLDAQL
jgi:hypothetical protein